MELNEGVTLFRAWYPRLRTDDPSRLILNLSIFISVGIAHPARLLQKDTYELLFLLETEEEWVQSKLKDIKLGMYKIIRSYFHEH